MIAHDCERFPDRGTRHSERILLPLRERSKVVLSHYFEFFH